MKQEMYDNMYLTDTYHWWFRGKREIVLGLAEPVLSAAEKIKSIDFGCGCGMMLGELARYGEVAGADFSHGRWNIAKKKMEMRGGCTRLIFLFLLNPGKHMISVLLWTYWNILKTICLQPRTFITSYGQAERVL